MVFAFYGADGRSISTQAALLASIGIRVAATRPVTLVRAVGPQDAPMPVPSTMPNAVRFVEHRAAGGDIAAVEQSVGAARRDGHAVVLDLPATCLTEASVERTAHLSILVVGPTRFDEEAAASMLRRLCPAGTAGNQDPELCDDGSPLPPWLLSWGRPGGAPAAAAFTDAMAACLAPAPGLPALPALQARFFPVALPWVSRAEMSALAGGVVMPSLLRAAVLLAAALQAAADAPHASKLDPQDFAARTSGGDPTLVTRDSRTIPERLRDLADALQALHDGIGPSENELAAAPVLQDWTVESRTVRALAGHVAGHPDFPSGRLITTSEIYASDGQTYARTLSRMYRLGTPAKGAATLAH